MPLHHRHFYCYYYQYYQQQTLQCINSTAIIDIANMTNISGARAARLPLSSINRCYECSCLANAATVPFLTLSHSCAPHTIQIPTTAAAR